MAPVRQVLALVAAMGAIAVGGRGAPPITSRTTPGRRPNILFVLTDDLDQAEMRDLPHVGQLVGRPGATFDDYFVSNSLCCPSRVTTLRGQYAHNTGVWSNGGTNGGFEVAYTEGLERDTVATRLAARGYRTLLAGKYLNGYPNLAGAEYRPAGWTAWASPVGGNPYGEYDYELNNNGRLEDYGHRPRDYGTAVYVRRTERFVRDAVRGHRPFFAYLAVYAPHQPATPAPRDMRKFPHAHAPRNAAFNQRDVSKMPGFVRDLPRFNTGEKAAIDELYRDRIRSLQAVDRGVASLVHTLRVAGQLDNTYVVFTSDNGFHLGEHRMPAGKQTAYDTDIHVPLEIRGPGIAPGSHVRDLTGNVDLAPTFEAMAGARTPTFVDGRSLLGLARHSPGAGRHWRDSYLVEHRDEDRAAGIAPPRARTLPLEPPDPDQGGEPRLVRAPRHRSRPWPRAKGHLLEPRDEGALRRHAPIPDYDAVRTSRDLYVEYADGERELYDTHADPGEIHNLAGTRPRLEHALARRVAALRRCRAEACRAAESAPLPADQR
ncbi:MAG TPA: sulfatase [Acidimicrobiia bacterium]|jgi:arylsulfatase A-like enzyme